MIHLVVGGSCAGKTTFVQDNFVKASWIREFKDIMPVSETEYAYIIGKMSGEQRRKGTDTVARQSIPLFFEQVQRLYGKGKDIVLEGTRIVSHKFFDELIAAGYECKIWLIDVSFETSLRRNKSFGSTVSEKTLKAEITKARNIYYEYCSKFSAGGQVVNTDDRRPELKSGLRDNFCVFILSHGRADRVITVGTLERCGYTGPWYIVCDDEDDTLPEYVARYGADKVLVFSKDEAATMFDEMAVNPDRRVIAYARNICFKLAKEKGFKYFLELDDDYTTFYKRWREGDRLMGCEATDLNSDFEAMLHFLDVSGAHSVAFAQGGDLIGGASNRRLKTGLLRKAMNTFFCDVDKPFQFNGVINEDVNTYTYLGSRGYLFFTFVWEMITQKATQNNAGGMTEVYLDTGTYTKSFYTVIGVPSAVKISAMGETHRRIHHKILWDNCVPKIISDRYKKRRAE